MAALVGLLSFVGIVAGIGGLFFRQWRRRSAYTACVSLFLFATAVAVSPNSPAPRSIVTGTAATARDTPSGSSDTYSRKDEYSARVAFAQCQKFAKDSFRDHWPVEFLEDYSGFNDAIVRKHGAIDYYDVLLKVIAANGFGGKAVAFIVCTVQHSGVAAKDEGWQLVNLQELDPAAAAPDNIPSAENTAATNCATKDAPECHSGLPPDLLTYSSEEISQRKTECSAGDFLSCYDLFRHHLNGNRLGYSCPVINYDNGIKFASKLLKGSIVCKTLKNVDFAGLLDGQKGDQALREWISKNNKACEFLGEDSEIKLLQKSADGYSYLVAIKKEHGRRGWVGGIDLLVAGAH